MIFLRHLVCETVCGGVEGIVMKADVDESKVWERVVGVMVCLWSW